mgnify:CR=1 FL=1|tara:strand:+ start:387 stop:545 length:159 start_codon:yes stop_codon:yes gene_type:complete
MNELFVVENHKKKKINSDWIAPDTQGKNFFDIGESLQYLAQRGAESGGAVMA